MSSTNPARLSGEEEIKQIMHRIEQLSRRPENPGIAYRNLDAIHTLIGTLHQRLGATVRHS